MQNSVTNCDGDLHREQQTTITYYVRAAASKELDH